jgi:hypothetical protein
MVRLPMENENPASINRAHRHFIVDDEVVISRAAPAPPGPSTPPNQVIASLESSFMRTFGRFGQPRIRTPSVTRREATESTAFQEAELESRRPRSRRRTPLAQSESTAQAAPILTPQEVEDSSELSQLDPSTPLIGIPLQSLGVLVKYSRLEFFSPETFPETSRESFTKSCYSCKPYRREDNSSPMGPSSFSRKFSSYTSFVSGTTMTSGALLSPFPRIYSKTMIGQSTKWGVFASAESTPKFTTLDNVRN